MMKFAWIASPSAVWSDSTAAADFLRRFNQYWIFGDFSKPSAKLDGWKCRVYRSHAL
jgi:hypothetical protein